jgi:hypothetical protein
MEAIEARATILPGGDLVLRVPTRLRPGPCLVRVEVADRDLEPEAGGWGVVRPPSAPHDPGLYGRTGLCVPAEAIDGALEAAREERWP